MNKSARSSTPAIPPAWASDVQLAQYYSVARVTIWQWVRTGKLPKPTKLSGGTSRWWMPDIRAMDVRAMEEQS